MLNVIQSFSNKDEILQFYDNSPMDISSNEFGIHDFKLRNNDGLRIQQHFTIHFIMRGKGTFNLAGKTYLLKENDIFFTPPNVLMNTTPDKKDPWKYFWIAMNGKGFREILSEIFSVDSPVYTCKSSEEIKSAIKALLDFYPAPKAAIRLRAISTAFRILSAIYKEKQHVVATTSSFSPEHYHQEAIEIIEKHYSNCFFKISDISDTLAISHSYLCKIFKHFSNTSANAYLIQIRMREARILLEKDTSSIQDIAYKVGYIDFAYFSREFKRLFGITPKQYRDIQRKKQNLIQ